MKYAAILAFSYLVGWFISYTVFMGFSYEYLFQYFALAWQSPGELPTFINIGALLFAGITTLVAWWLIRLKRR